MTVTIMEPDLLRLAGHVATLPAGREALAGPWRRLADTGTNIVVNYVSDRKAAEEVVRSAQEKGGKQFQSRLMYHI
jgi:hypothetical protein